MNHTSLEDSINCSFSVFGMLHDGAETLGDMV